jgi:coniferyl-aldehyde dehydrogenase
MSTTTAVDLHEALRIQREAFLVEGPPTAAVRRERIDRLIVALLDGTDEFIAALDEDFGSRPAAASLAGDLLGPLADAKYTRRNLERWMRPRRVPLSPLRLAGVRAWVEPQPLGVVGVMTTWNFPLTLAVQPTVAALAAGNRVMIKMTEVVPRTAELLRSAVAARFDPAEVLLITGGVEVSKAFSALPFDHLFFTGSPNVGRLVQRAAAEHLVPVTLELGGKNPAVIAEDVDFQFAARRLATARMTNGGQLCLCPDYAFVPAERLEEFAHVTERALRATFPTILENDGYLSIVNRSHYERITGLVEDARAKGARVVQIHGPDESFPSPETRRIPPTLLLDVTPQMDAMNQELFGPVLALLPYHDLDDVIAYVNSRPLPLCAYWYGDDTSAFQRFKARTRTGGLTRNDFALHMFVDGAPFGGVGESGSGYYHGQYGFDTFSHLRGVAVGPKPISPMAFASPPFTPAKERALRLLVAIERRAAHRRLSR